MRCTLTMPVLSYGFNKENHTQARHYSLYMDNNVLGNFILLIPGNFCIPFQNVCIYVCVDLMGALEHIHA